MARSRVDDLSAPVHGSTGLGLLSHAVRRDLLDLNLAYLDLGLSLAGEDDPLVAWSPAVRDEIAAPDRAVRARMAECPFSLFKFGLAGTVPPGPDSPRVEDTGVLTRPAGRPPGCAEFSASALFAAWRLADSAPIAARIVFGLTPSDELLLNELRPSRVGVLAANPAVVRARWPDRARFWSALRTAAESGTAAALQWVHCMGICLVDGGPVEVGGDDPGLVPGRRRR